MAKGDAGLLTLWVEAQFEFPELKKPKGKHPTIPGHFAHMQLESADGIARVRFRLTATMDEDGDIDSRRQRAASRTALKAQLAHVA